MNKNIISALVVTAALILPPNSNLRASPQSPREYRSLGLGIWLGGADGLAGAWVSYYLTTTLDIEASGMSLSADNLSYTVVHAGPKWHFLGHRFGQSWSPYAGAEMQYVRTSSGNITASHKENGLGIYIPVGIELVAPAGFNFAFELAYQSKIPTAGLIQRATGSSEFNGFWAGIKLGYRFSNWSLGIK